MTPAIPADLRLELERISTFGEPNAEVAVEACRRALVELLRLEARIEAQREAYRRWVSAGHP